jgi:hypothetical protein
MTKAQLRQLDYEKTVMAIQSLTDIRFKLLALLPLATGGTLAWSEPTKEPATGVALGALGFLATLGILFYDQRNTELYERYVRRAKLLELRLRVPPSSTSEDGGGPFMNRAGRGRRFLGITMWHDRGLSLVYATVLGAWGYLLATSLTSGFVTAGATAQWRPASIGGAIGVVVFAVTLVQLWVIDSRKPEQIAALDTEIDAVVKRRTCKRAAQTERTRGA